MDSATLFRITLAYFQETKWVSLDDVQARFKFLKTQGRSAA